MLNFPPSAFGSHLRTLREARNLSQQQLADMCGLVKRTVSALEMGRRFPNGQTLCRLARALSVPVAELADPLCLDVSRMDNAA